MKYTDYYFREGQRFTKSLVEGYCGSFEAEEDCRPNSIELAEKSMGMIFNIFKTRIWNGIATIEDILY